MGLDMYLFRREKRPAGEEVAYWRKANQIREWFASHVGVDNCREAPVTKEILMKLRHDCKRVLDNHELAEKILSTSEGFFFGSTDYDEWYFQDLEDTIVALDKIIKETDWDKEEVYYYEWW